MKKRIYRVCSIYFEDPKSTLYAKAKEGRDKNGWKFWMHDNKAFLMAILSGGGTAATATLGAVLFAGGAVVLPVAGWLAAGGFAAYRYRKFRQELAAIVNDPSERFKTDLAQMVKDFNEVAEIWNHWLEGCRLGHYPEDEDKIRFGEQLEELRVELQNVVDQFNWQEKTKKIHSVSSEPQLVGSFEKLVASGQDLRASLAALKNVNGFPGERRLENEAAAMELEGDLQKRLPARGK